jgi:hypothetical protein
MCIYLYRATDVSFLHIVIEILKAIGLKLISYGLNMKCPPQAQMLKASFQLEELFGEGLETSVARA